MKVALVDYGVGNIFSVEHALKFLGLDYSLDQDGSAILNADLAIVPGVASFGTGMVNLQKRHQADALREFHSRGLPLIGLCLGAQMLLETSTESASIPGLGFIKGHVSLLDTSLCQVPQQGWSRLLAKHVPFFSEFDQQYFYFSHSYKMLPKLSSSNMGTAQYGMETATAFFFSDNLLGVQFHPERSGPIGLKFLEKAINSASIWT